MSIIITIVLGLIIFGIVILFHEFGHFITAKLSGIQVNEFAIGMGPALFHKTWKGTQYSIRALPIGGYVAMEGEDSPESTRSGEEESDSEEAAEDDPKAQQESSKAEEKECRPTGMPFNQAKLWKRAVIMAAGAVMNFVLGYLVLLGIVGCEDSIVTLKIYGFESGAKCAQTGLQAEDEIVAINGRACYVPEDITYELSRTENYSADFTVRRGGQKVQLNNVQFDTYVDEDGRTYMPPQLTVYSLQKTPLRVMRQAWNYERYYARIVFSTLIDLARGRESINNLSGPVGIVAAIGQAAAVDWQTLFSLTVLLTVNLGIFNLLPIPALDGGKLVFLLLEGILRRPVPEKIQGYVNLAGFVLLLGLMIFATCNDVIRLFTGQMF